MSRPFRWLGALLGVVALARLLGRRREQAPAPASDRPDPRAEELRRRLAESRALVDERDEFEAAETAVDEADEAPAADPADRRRDVHDSARAALDEMHGRRPDVP